MTREQMIVTIVVAVIGAIATALGGGFAFAQFLIKRKDEKEANDIQKRIDSAVEQSRKEMMERLDNVSKERSEEGAVRFQKHAEAIIDINKQISENNKQIGELTSLTKDVLQNMASLNKVVSASAESQRNSNYDRILIVTNNILKSGRMTITDKTNLKQLYKSWIDLNGNDPKIDTYYEECMKIAPIPDGG